MYHNREDIFYYLTVGNENYVQPAMPAGVREGILRGIYRLRRAPAVGKHGPKEIPHVHLLGSGAILNEVVKAQKLLADKFGIAADVWSVTSYKRLHRNALEVERWNMLHPEEKPRVPYLTEMLSEKRGVYVAASDYLKLLPNSIARWLPGPLVSLGTDGFGRSEDRVALRDFFEVDARYVVLAALHALARDGHIKRDVPQKAVKDLNINPDKANPVTV